MHSSRCVQRAYTKIAHRSDSISPCEISRQDRLIRLDSSTSRSWLLGRLKRMSSVVIVVSLTVDLFLIASTGTVNLIEGATPHIGTIIGRSLAALIPVSIEDVNQGHVRPESCSSLISCADRERWPMRWHGETDVGIRVGLNTQAGLGMRPPRRANSSGRP